MSHDRSLPRSRAQFNIARSRTRQNSGIFKTEAYAGSQDAIASSQDAVDDPYDDKTNAELWESANPHAVGRAHDQGGRRPRATSTHSAD